MSYKSFFNKKLKKKYFIFVFTQQILIMSNNYTEIGCRLLFICKILQLTVLGDLNVQYNGVQNGRTAEMFTSFSWNVKLQSYRCISRHPIELSVDSFITHFYENKLADHNIWLSKKILIAKS